MAGNVTKDVTFTVLAVSKYDPREYKGKLQYQYKCKFNDQEEWVSVQGVSDMQPRDRFSGDLTINESNGKLYYNVYSPRAEGQKHPSEQSTQERSTAKPFTPAPVVPLAVLKTAGQDYMVWCVKTAEMALTGRDSSGDEFAKIAATTAIVGEKMGIPAAMVLYRQQEEEERKRIQGDRTRGNEEDFRQQEDATPSQDRDDGRGYDDRRPDEEVPF